MCSRFSSRQADGAALATLVLALAAGACEREHRDFRSSPPTASAQTAVREGELQPGPPTRVIAVRGPYDGNAYGVSEGKRLYNQFNCSGCHFQGGGGIGPPLMDAQWIYGSAPENIFETIVEGRPNGSYVRSMSGLLPKDVAPGRGDVMQVRPQEQSTGKPAPDQGAAQGAPTQ